MKKTLKLFYLVSCFVLFLAIIPRTAVAEEDVPEPDPISGCNPEASAYGATKANFSLDIQRTVGNMLNATITNGFAAVNGVSPNKLIMCQKYVKEQAALANPDWGDPPKETALCAPTAEEEEYIESVCKPLVSYIGTEGRGEEQGSKGSNLAVYKRAIEGSLIGMGTKLEGFSRKEPLPVNLAYYWDQSVGNIPVVGRALAQGGSEAYENLPVVAAVYSIWRLSLRVALGLISVVLLYAGLMIVMRKKVSSQLVVSVQYALPKIVIAVVLIIFSYPIGAVITSIGFALYRGAFPIVFNLMTGGMVNANEFASGTLSIALIADTLSQAKGGFGYIVVALIMSALLHLAKIILYFKVLIVYIKMAFSIVTAPLEFALGAVPGNDKSITGWFTRMAKYALTIFGMGVVIPLTLVVGLEVSVAYSRGTGETGGWGNIISLIVPILIVIFGFGMGMSMEGKVDALFGGGKKK
jgi:hypothetical protein